jgi:hypothetical protein
MPRPDQYARYRDNVVKEIPIIVAKPKKAKIKNLSDKNIPIIPEQVSTIQSIVIQWFENRGLPTDDIGNLLITLQDNGVVLMDKTERNMYSIDRRPRKVTPLL